MQTPSRATLPLPRSSVAAVVVTYQPEKQALLALLHALQPQVARLIVVDNAPVGSALSEWHLGGMFPNLKLLQLGGNQGIASAQNRGIALALEGGASHVLLCDQDSIPEPDMVARLLEGLAVCVYDTGAMPVAAISPATIDRRTGRVSTFIPSERQSASVIADAHAANPCPRVDAGFLIASGMLIPAAVWATVGGLRSEFFIDHVDTEWCFRARAAGYRLVGLEQALLHHSLGDEIQKVWFLRERHVATHAPLRDYYMARNTLAMIGAGHLSLAWSAHFLWRIVQFLGFYVLLSSHKRQHLKMLFLGLLHGLRGIHGKLNPETLQTEPVPRSALDPGQ
ncbi:MAG: rhamnosyl transferase [Comamonadaceae bacterium PBBC2]|nr:MAG: rhamnosyl transferase [Comamonadaceae bacterium PBBC2]